MDRVHLRESARHFAKKWYGRAQSGCDEETLSCMVESLLVEVHRAICEGQRVIVVKKLEKLLYD